MLDKENVDDDLPKAGVQIYVLSMCFSPRRRKRQGLLHHFMSQVNPKHLTHYVDVRCY